MELYERNIFEDAEKRYAQSELSQIEYEDIYNCFWCMSHLPQVRPYLLAMKYLGLGTEADPVSVMSELRQLLSESNYVLRGLYYDIRLLSNLGNESDREELIRCVENGYTDRYLKELSQVNNLVQVDIKTGDYFLFGSYSQNADGSSEPIKWEVLDIKNGRALMLSEKVLECFPYHLEFIDVTWETSHLREWLNGKNNTGIIENTSILGWVNKDWSIYSKGAFLVNAFTPEEQKLISDNLTLPHSNPIYPSKQGNMCYDKVFLLSIKEMIDYYSSDGYEVDEWQTYMKINGKEITCEISDYLKTKPCKQEEERCSWWLRTNGDENKYVSIISEYFANEISITGDAVNSIGVGVRPAIWLNLYKLPDYYQNKNLTDENRSSGRKIFAGINDLTKERKVECGDLVEFGSYPQDLKGENLPIIWRVLDIDDDKIMLISEKVLDCIPFSSNEDTTWESSYLREWLNGSGYSRIASNSGLNKCMGQNNTNVAFSFLDKAFSEYERSIIGENHTEAHRNLAFDTEQGNDCIDKVFILSMDETIKHYCNNELERKNDEFSYWIKIGYFAAAKLTKYVAKNIFLDQRDQNSFCCWWLRTNGDCKSSISCVMQDGTISASGYQADDQEMGVRPAIWVKI